MLIFIYRPKTPRTPMSWDPEDDILLKQLKEEQRLGWKEIATHCKSACIHYLSEMVTNHSFSPRTDLSRMPIPMEKTCFRYPEVLSRSQTPACSNNNKLQLCLGNGCHWLVPCRQRTDHPISCKIPRTIVSSFFSPAQSTLCVRQELLPSSSFKLFKWQLFTSIARVIFSSAAHGFPNGNPRDPLLSTTTTNPEFPWYSLWLLWPDASILLANGGG